MRSDDQRQRNVKSAVITGVSIIGAFVFFMGVLPQLVLVETPRPEVHTHTMLRLVVDGQEQKVPANIGIDSSLYKSHVLDDFGLGDGLAPIHTHDESGTIHVEALSQRDFTLGEFFDIWGYEIPDGSTVAFTWTDSKGIGDIDYTYRSHVLKDGENLNLVIST